jgi:hypothetical protein
MYDEHRKLTYNQVIDRDENRFKTADRDGNQKLSREEYADFLHPGKAIVYLCRLCVCTCCTLLHMYHNT